MALSSFRGNHNANRAPHMRSIALCLGISAAAILAGCVGSQPPIGAPGAMPQTSAIATHAERDKSWMLPEAKSEALLYAADFPLRSVHVFAYPKGTPVGNLTGFDGGPEGVCIDQNGHIFVTVADSETQGYVYEYQHGGKEPIETLSDAGWANSCSVDPVTENLAVANTWSTQDRNLDGDVAIYQNAEGPPTIYSDAEFNRPAYCTYDGAGDVFIDSGGPDIIGELPSGGSTFAEITLDLDIWPQSLQWLNGTLVTPGGTFTHHGREKIFQIAVSGSSGTVTKVARLWSYGDSNPEYGVADWVQGSTIVGPDIRQDALTVIRYWRYPRGGRPTKTLKVSGGASISSVVVSPSLFR